MCAPMMKMSSQPNAADRISLARKSFLCSGFVIVFMRLLYHMDIQSSRGGAGMGILRIRDIVVETAAIRRESLD